jgi:hypothetical protein
VFDYQHPLLTQYPRNIHLKDEYSSQIEPIWEAGRKAIWTERERGREKGEKRDR